MEKEGKGVEGSHNAQRLTLHSDWSLGNVDEGDWLAHKRTCPRCPHHCDHTFGSELLYTKDMVVGAACR